MTLDDYHSIIREQVDDAREFANNAKTDSDDPSEIVEIDQAEDLAERCEKLIGVDGIKETIREMEEDDYEREEIAFQLAKQFATGESGDFDTDDEKIDAAIRTAVALLTEGVVAAPLDGIGEITLEENDDGTTFIRVPYYGPIRSAGGTGQALSVLVADYIRQELGLAPFKPRENEVHRYVEEMELYDGEVGLQYMPKEKETKLIIENCPIMLDGVQTTDREVGGYRDLERIEGNRGRGGMCLVVGEGIAQKAPKIQKFRDEVGIEGWDWIDKLVSGSEDDSDTEDDTETQENQPLHYTNDLEEAQDPFEGSEKFLSDALAGRPIISGPNQKGAWRLRYGRARNLGLAASGISPVSIYAGCNEYFVTGSQMKTQLPGKAQGVAPVTTIEGPTVKLSNGEVRKPQTIEEAQELQTAITEIIDSGEILIPYGEFLENNHDLAPSPYVQEWWLQDLQNAGMPTDNLKPENTTLETAIKMSENFDIPLQPKFTPHWSNITPQQYNTLAHALQTKKPSSEDKYDHQITIEDPTILEWLLIEHKQETGFTETNENEPTTVHITEDNYTLLNTFCHPLENPDQYKNTLQAVNDKNNIEIRPQVTIRIGSRLGRNEKSERRTMGSRTGRGVNTLFPVGRDPDISRDLLKAADQDKGGNKNFSNKIKTNYKGQGVQNVQINIRDCPTCNHTTWKIKCPHCNTRTEQKSRCTNCGNIEEPDQHGEDCQQCHNGTHRQATYQDINIRDELNNALETLNRRRSQINYLKAVEGLTSKNKIPESLEKGILRDKNDLSTFRDGTNRYDMVDLPLTSFTPKEINLTIKQTKNLGYTHDIHGNKITNEEQLIELYPQDLIIDKKAGDYLLRSANYIDELLEKYYNTDPYYNAETKQDLVGKLVMGLAPHTSASVTGRIIGFADAKAQYAHPLFHAAKRRNCFHPNTTLNVKLNGNWQETTIEELVETYLQPESDGYDDTYTDGSIVQQIKNHPVIDELKVPSMTDDGFRTLEDVESLTKNVDSSHMVSIDTDSEDMVEVTPDHTLEVLEDGNLTEKKAIEIETGDKMISSPTGHNTVEPDWASFDILETILHSDVVSNDQVMVRGMSKGEIEVVYRDSQNIPHDQYSYLQEVADSIGMNKKTLSNYLYRDSVPADILMKLTGGDIDEIVDIVPMDVKIAVKRDSVEVPREIIVDEEMSALLGYYAAEGFTRIQENDTRGKTVTGVKQVDIANIDQQAKDFITSVFKKKFNITDPYENEKRITASGTPLYVFFKDVIDGGDAAHNKSVPDVIKGADDGVKGAYLSGYISGDGSHSNGVIKMSTVSTGLRNGVSTLLKELDYEVSVYEGEPVDLHERFPNFYEPGEKMSRTQYTIRMNRENSEQFIQEHSLHLDRKLDNPRSWSTATVTSVEHTEFDGNATYNITVNNTHRIPTGEVLYPLNCDGDEDSVMLLMDGFLNFSEQFLPDRIGRAMDAPMVMTAVIDPYEVDDEAHNVDIVGEYPREWYEGTWELNCPSPKELELPILEDILDDPTGVQHSHETMSLDAGPRDSMYVRAEGWGYIEQLDVCTKLRGVDEDMVARKVLEKHFVPSLMGVLTSLTTQEFRCQACNTKYGVPPLSGECEECADGGNLLLTMYPGSVEQWDETINEVIEMDFNLPDYLEQRIELLRERVERLIEDDTNKQAGLGEFM